MPTRTDILNYCCGSDNRSDLSKFKFFMYENVARRTIRSRSIGYRRRCIRFRYQLSRPILEEKFSTTINNFKFDKSKLVFEFSVIKNKR